VRGIRLLLVVAALLTTAVSLHSAISQGAPDTDADGVPDEFDNCTLVPNGPLLGTGACDDQRDGDEDGFGNPCDFDYDNDGIVGIRDVYAFSIHVPPPEDPNCDGAWGIDDIDATMNARYTLPGPSSLACSAANEKFSCPPEWTP